MKKIIMIGIGLSVGVVFGYGACWILNPITITIEDYQLLNQDMVDRLKRESCAEDVLAVRKELEEKFQQALVDRDIQCGQWEVCDCNNPVTIIESNCDTTELEAQLGDSEAELDYCVNLLEECSGENEQLSIQVRNLMYK